MYIVLAAIIIVQGILMIKEVNKRKADRDRYEGQDEALTQSVADNLDLKIGRAHV